MEKRNASLQEFTQHNGSWLFAAAGCIVLRVLMGTCSDNGLSLKSLIDSVYTASFLAIAGLAQILMVTTGYGVIGLSVSGMITLGAYVSVGLCNGWNSMILPVLLAVVASGVLVSFLSSMMIIHLKIPAVIATVAMSYLIMTVTVLIGHNFNVFTMPSTPKNIATFHMAGVPVMTLLVMLLTLAIHFLLTSTTCGKGLLAMGQGLEVTCLTRVDVGETQILTYVFAAVLVGLYGALISTRATGAYPGMGNSHQMDNIACTVMGGMLISGGRANTAGTLVGLLFLCLTISYMRLVGANAGIQNMVKGVSVIVVPLIGAAENSGKNLRKRCEDSTVCEVRTS